MILTRITLDAEVDPHTGTVRILDSTMDPDHRPPQEDPRDYVAAAKLLMPGSVLVLPSP